MSLPQGINQPSSASQSMLGMGRKDASLQDLERLAQRDNENFVMLGEGKDYAASAENLGVHEVPHLSGGPNSNSMNYLKQMKNNFVSGIVGTSSTSLMLGQNQLRGLNKGNDSQAPSYKMQGSSELLEADDIESPRTSKLMAVAREAVKDPQISSQQSYLGSRSDPVADILDRVKEDEEDDEIDYNIRHLSDLGGLTNLDKRRVVVSNDDIDEEISGDIQDVIGGVRALAQSDEEVDIAQIDVELQGSPKDDELDVMERLMLAQRMQVSQVNQNQILPSSAEVETYEEQNPQFSFNKFKNDMQTNEVNLNDLNERVNLKSEMIDEADRQDEIQYMLKELLENQNQEHLNLLDNFKQTPNNAENEDDKVEIRDEKDLMKEMNESLSPPMINSNKSTPKIEQPKSEVPAKKEETKQDTNDENDSFHRLYNKEIKVNQDEIPLLLMELTDIAYKFIKKEQHEKAYVLLQKTESVLEVVNLEYSKRDKFFAYITYHNMAMCFQKLGMLEECIIYLKETIQVIEKPNFFKDISISLRMRQQHMLCQLKLQLCAILSQTQKHSDAMENAKQSVRLSHQILRDMYDLCVFYSNKIKFKDDFSSLSLLLMDEQNPDQKYSKSEFNLKLQQKAHIKENSPVRDIPYTLLEESISMIERTALKILPIMKELGNRLAGSFGKKGLQAFQQAADAPLEPDGSADKSALKDKIEKKIKNNEKGLLHQSDEEDLKDLDLDIPAAKSQNKSIPAAEEQVDMRTILGFLNQNEWILNLNIGNIMQIQPIRMRDCLNMARNEQQLSRESFLEKLQLLIVSYFCVSTEMRFIIQSRAGFMRPEVRNEKELEQEYWHVKALDIACAFLPSECPLFNHILLSYQKHHDPTNQPINEDEEQTDEIRVLRPLKGIENSKYQPMIRDIDANHPGAKVQIDIPDVQMSPLSKCFDHRLLPKRIHTQSINMQTDPIEEPQQPAMHSQSTAVNEVELGFQKSPYENIEDDSQGLYYDNLISKIMEDPKIKDKQIFVKKLVQKCNLEIPEKNLNSYMNTNIYDSNTKTAISGKQLSDRQKYNNTTLSSEINKHYRTGGSIASSSNDNNVYGHNHGLANKKNKITQSGHIKNFGKKIESNTFDNKNNAASVTNIHDHVRSLYNDSNVSGKDSISGLAGKQRDPNSSTATLLQKQQPYLDVGNELSKKKKSTDSLGLRGRQFAQSGQTSVTEKASLKKNQNINLQKKNKSKKVLNSSTMMQDTTKRKSKKKKKQTKHEDSLMMIGGIGDVMSSSGAEETNDDADPDLQPQSSSRSEVMLNVTDKGVVKSPKVKPEKPIQQFDVKKRGASSEITNYTSGQSGMKQRAKLKQNSKARKEAMNRLQEQQQYLNHMRKIAVNYGHNRKQKVYSRKKYSSDQSGSPPQNNEILYQHGYSIGQQAGVSIFDHSQAHSMSKASLNAQQQVLNRERSKQSMEEEQRPSFGSRDVNTVHVSTNNLFARYEPNLHKMSQNIYPQRGLGYSSNMPTHINTAGVNSQAQLQTAQNRTRVTSSDKKKRMSSQQSRRPTPDLVPKNVTDKRERSGGAPLRYQNASSVQRAAKNNNSFGSNNRSGPHGYSSQFSRSRVSKSKSSGQKSKSASKSKSKSAKTYSKSRSQSNERKSTKSLKQNNFKNKLNKLQTKLLMSQSQFDNSSFEVEKSKKKQQLSRARPKSSLLPENKNVIQQKRKSNKRANLHNNSIENLQRQVIENQKILNTMAQQKSTKGFKANHENMGISKKHGHNNSISHNIQNTSDLMANGALKPSNQTYHNLNQIHQNEQLNKSFLSSGGTSGTKRKSFQNTVKGISSTNKLQQSGSTRQDLFNSNENMSRLQNQQFSNSYNTNASQKMVRNDKKILTQKPKLIPPPPHHLLSSTTGTTNQTYAQSGKSSKVRKQQHNNNVAIRKKRRSVQGGGIPKAPGQLYNFEQIQAQLENGMRLGGADINDKDYMLDEMLNSSANDLQQQFVPHMNIMPKTTGSTAHLLKPQEQRSQHMNIQQRQLSQTGRLKKKK